MQAASLNTRKEPTSAANFDRGFKPSTVNRRLAAVVSFYRYLIAEGRADTCPVLPRRHYLRKFFSAIEDIRDRAICTLMLRCGLRIGEVSGLKMADLYLEDVPPRVILHGKGSRERTVYLSSAARLALQAWLAQRPAARNQHIFLSYKHKKLSTTSISKRIKYICYIGGVDLTAHRLRHSFGRSYGRANGLRPAPHAHGGVCPFGVRLGRTNSRNGINFLA